MFSKGLNALRYALGYLGINLSTFWSTVSGLPWYFNELSKFKKAASKSDENWPLSIYPIFTDRKDMSGSARGQYFYQDLYVANLIAKNKPQRHVDIGSRIDGFVAHVASYREIDVMDIRPLKDDLQNINFIQADLMKMDQANYQITDSLSCLHTIEHFGLGRYTDPIDFDGHKKGLDAMYEMIKPGGTFYFSTQIGPQKVFFNAHRIFSVAYLLDLFKGKYHVETFTFIDDNDNLHIDVPLTEEKISSNYGCKMGCGIFVLSKI